MKKQAKQLKKGDKIVLGGKKCLVKEIELSEIGKQGARKVRLVLKAEDRDEDVVIIRPEDYPFES